MSGAETSSAARSCEGSRAALSLAAPRAQAETYTQPVGGQVPRLGQVQLYTHDGAVHDGSMDAQ